MKPRAAHRRPARRTRAGHHDRLATDTSRPRSASSSSPTPGPHSVHAHMNHRRVHGEPGAHSRRRPARHFIEQSRRHAFLASLLGVPHLVLCVNKMDLVDYDQAVFFSNASRTSSASSPPNSTYATRVHPRFRLAGRQRGRAFDNTPWYEGTSLLHHLGRGAHRLRLNLIDCRFPCNTSSGLVTTPITTTAATQARSRAYLQEGRRGRRAASGFTVDDRIDRHRRRRARRSDARRCRHHFPPRRRKSRRQPGRHESAGYTTVRMSARRRCDALLVQRRRPAQAGSEVTRSSTRATGRARW